MLNPIDSTIETIVSSDLSESLEIFNRNLTISLMTTKSYF